MCEKDSSSIGSHHSEIELGVSISDLCAEGRELGAYVSQPGLIHVVLLKKVLGVDLKKCLFTFNGKRIFNKKQQKLVN